MVVHNCVVDVCWFVGRCYGFRWFVGKRYGLYGLVVGERKWFVSGLVLVPRTGAGLVFVFWKGSGFFVGFTGGSWFVVGVACFLEVGQFAY
jgi:hypothetical protein